MVKLDGSSRKQSASATQMKWPNSVSRMSSSKEHSMKEKEITSLATHVNWQKSYRSALTIG